MGLSSPRKFAPMEKELQMAAKSPVEFNINVPWGKIAARSWGSPSPRTPVLLVHGTMDNLGSFNRLVPFLPKDLYYVAIDLPGHGLSSPFPPGVPLYTLSLVRAVKLVLDHLKWTTCIYIGHSLGGTIGLYFTLTCPERVERLISLDSIGYSLTPHEDFIDFVRSAFDQEDKYLSGSPPRLYSKDEILYALRFRRQNALNTEAANALLERAVTAVAGVEQGTTLYKLNRDPRMNNLIRPNLTVGKFMEVIMKKLTIPLLVVVATSSLEVNRVSEEHVALLEVKTNISLVVVEGNHDVHNNHPERVAPHICKVLSPSSKL